MTGLTFRTLAASLSALALILVASFGQPALSASPAISAEEIDSAPVPAIVPMLTPVENRGWIGRYLRAGGASPEIVARRAAELIRRIGASRETLKPEQLLAAVDQIAHVAARSLSVVPVIQLAIAEDFRPDNAAIAWDFGPSDGAPMAGFERVPPEHHRLAGARVAALRRAAADNLLADGIAGLSRIELELPDGDYRIILMTQNFGVDRLTALPFGAELRINGIPMIVGGGGPAGWTRSALLTRSGVRAAGAGFRRMGDFMVGEFADEAAALYPHQQGGALVVAGRAEGGKLVIEFAGFGEAQAQSYLTGLIAEPADTVSDLVLSEEAQRALLPQAVRLALETEILLAAAEAVEGIAPAAGQALRSSDVVTPN